MEIREKAAIGLDAAMGVCYGLRRWIAPSNKKGTESVVNEVLEEEIQKIDNLFDKAERAKNGIRNFIQKPEVRFGWKILKSTLEKMAEKKEGQKENV